jgi:hypothetical protein
MLHVRYPNIRFTHASGFYLLEGVNKDAYRFFAVVIGLPFSEKKIIPRNTE